MPRALGVTGHCRRFSGSQPMLHHATRYATLRNMPWHAIRIRSDLHRIIQAQAVEQSRSVAKQVDWLLSRALEQTSGNSPEEGGPSRLTGAPSSARAPEPRAERPAPTPEGSSDRVGTATQALDTVEGQTDIYEMLAGCPECAGRIESVGDGPQRCVDCGFTREGS
jgi:hypothetical protein